MQGPVSIGSAPPGGGAPPRGGENLDDPAAMYSFIGREEVMDLVYKPEMTPFLKRAANAGCRIQNGFDMFIRQASYQYTQFTGNELPQHLLDRLRGEE